MSHYEIIVVGGGVVGLCTALAMAQKGRQLALIDAGDFTVNTDTPDLRVYAINPASQLFLQSLGVWSLLPAHRLSPYRHMHVWDGTSQAAINFDARMIAASSLGFIIEESILKQALLQRLADFPNIDRFPQQRISRVDSEEPIVSVHASNQSWQTDLLLVADGANSPLRSLLQTPIDTWSYHQHALVARVKTHENHQQTAWQIFNPQGPLAFLPLVDEHTCSIVWSTSPQHAQSLMQLDDDTFNEQLQAAFANKLGAVRVIGERRLFPLQMRQAQQYVGDNWALLGDAAHTVHPLAGLGLNLGLADVRCLVDLMQKAPNGLLGKASLGAYQRQRRSEVWQTILALDSLKTLFASPFPPMRFLRGVGLNLCNQLPFIKRLFIEQASR